MKGGNNLCKNILEKKGGKNLLKIFLKRQKEGIC